MPILALAQPIQTGNTPLDERAKPTNYQTMPSIKTYNHVNRQDDRMSFHISRMEELYQKSKGRKNAPHRHEFYTVLLVKTARGQHVIDFTSYPLNDQQVYFISPYQVHQLIEDTPSFGYSIAFSPSFLTHNNISLQFIDNLNLFHGAGDTPPLMPNREEIGQLERYAEELISVHRSTISFKYEALGALVRLLLIQCNNLRHSPATNDFYTENTGHALLQNYKRLLNEHYSNWHNVSDYANELHVTADYLNRVVKGLTGKTAKEHIQSRIIVASKRLIYFSSLSNKELAYQLGFSEPANFSAFFKKCTGLSPSEFKKQEERQRNTREVSTHVGNP